MLTKKEHEVLDDIINYSPSVDSRIGKELTHSCKKELEGLKEKGFIQEIDGYLYAIA